MSNDPFDFDLDLDFDFDLGTGSADAAESDDVFRALQMLYDNDAQGALSLVEELKAAQGATPLVRHLLALCIVRLGRIVPAIRILRGCHEDAPNAFEHVEVLASLLAQAGQQAEAVFNAKLATALKRAYPAYPLVPAWLTNFSLALFMTEESPLTDRGDQLMRDGALERAAEAYVDSIELDPQEPRAWRGLIDVNRLRHRPGDSLRAAEALVAVRESDPEAHVALARCQLDIGDVAACWKSVNAALQASGADASVAQAMPGLVRYDTNAVPGFGLQLAEAWSALAAIEPKPVPAMQRPKKSDKFRVGVLSGELRSGSEKVGLLSTIEECIGAAADLYYYSNSDSDDAVSRRLRRRAIRWRTVHKVDDETVAAIIRNDEVQILLDLDGFDWSGRPGVVARRPAPAVLSVLADPGVVAAPGVYALGEPGLPGYDGQSPMVLSVEEGLSTWPLYVVAQEEEAGAAPHDGPLRILIDGPTGRLSLSFLTLLAEAVRGGLTALLTVRGDDPTDATSTELLAERFREAGLDLDTVERIPADTRLESIVDRVDVLLDTVPVPSTEAAFVSLRHGVPVVSLAPSNAANGAVSSLLFSMGLSTWVAPDSAAVAEKLIWLGSGPAARQEARSAIRKAVRVASGVDVRQRRGEALTKLFDDLLARAAEENR